MLRLLQHWFGQDSARRNALLASTRLSHQRRQYEDVQTYLNRWLPADTATRAQLVDTSTPVGADAR